jgi:L-serine/L-threonine ammonia-lyase
MSEQPIFIETPLIFSVPMSRRFGRDVYLKMEALQPSGSFKIRGVELMMRNAKANGAKQYFCSSGGNAGAAAAYVANVLGMPLTVVIPHTTPDYMADLMRSYGALVVVEGSMWSEADTHARTLIADFEKTHGKDTICYVHPFDHPDLWTGHSSMVKEMEAQLPRAAGHRCGVARAAQDDEPIRPAAIVLSTGGGGLLSGVCEGLAQSEDWNGVPVVAAETEGAASLAASIHANHAVRLPQITSLAVTLGATQVSQVCLLFLILP